MNIIFDESLGQFVAQTPAGECYGDTWSECLDRLAEALRIEAKHFSVNGHEPELLHLSEHAEESVAATVVAALR